ncbi:sporulation protein YunB [Ruminococcus flavefaciens]|uniref:sporulation protein YunB n=1 Tax=Ruminococcus flavefaciens TaxID=1265 RepID=UPI0026E9A390|nr:sporulation protein YunB [Ruminococcus flavefaciens]
MRTMRRKRYHRYRVVILLSIISIVVFIVFIETEKALKPVAKLRAEQFAKQTADNVIAAVVSEYLTDNRFTYEDFAVVMYNDDNSPVSVEAIPFTINKIQSELTAEINKRLNSSGNRSAKIPLGSLTGSPVFTGKGPSIKIRVCPVGSAEVKLKSSFTQAGLNQTCHSISACVDVKMTSSVPMYSFNVKAEFEFILAESVIVGKVPDITPYMAQK